MCTEKLFDSPSYIVTYTGTSHVVAGSNSRQRCRGERNFVAVRSFQHVWAFCAKLGDFYKLKT